MRRRTRKQMNQSSMRVFVLFLMGCILSLRAAGQADSLFVLPDSAKAFTLQHFYTLVLEYHPTARQVALLSEVARQEIRLARGGFDPKLELQYQQKNYNSNEYYELFRTELKFPSVFPFDPKIGVERNEGAYLDPQNYIGSQFNYRQYYTGLSLPLGRGLITDERRAALNQAKLFATYTEAEQVKLINKLLLDAAKAYWKWYYAYYNFRAQTRGVAIASEVFRRVKMNAVQGEASTLDTVQASITRQERLVQRQEAFLDFRNAGIQLSAFLWDSLANPISLPMNWAPVRPVSQEVLTAGELEHLKEQAQLHHPELRKLTVKVEQLDVERKLNQEYLKPRFDVSYAWLNQPIDPAGNASFGFGDNYKFGVDFSFPLLIRKERAKLQQTKVKLSSTRFEQGLMRRQVSNQIEASYNTLTNSGLLIDQLRGMVSNYERLLSGEYLNLENGESDLFKINVQQEKLINALSKYLKLLSEYEANKAELYWAAGVERLGVKTGDME